MANWLFTYRPTTHVVRLELNFAVVIGILSFKFYEHRLRSFEDQEPQNHLSPLIWMVAYTTACTAQVVITKLTGSNSTSVIFVNENENYHKRKNNDSVNEN